MISVTKLRNGVTFEHKSDPWRVQEYKHVHLSRGSGNITIKARNLRTGKTSSMVFRSGEKVNEIDVEQEQFVYLYKDDDELVLMNPKSYEQTKINSKRLGNLTQYLIEGQEVKVLFWRQRVLNVEIPTKMTMTVWEASPGVKGDTVSGATKEVVMETGIRIKVPLFIKKGDKIVVDTRDGSYVERTR